MIAARLRRLCAILLTLATLQLAAAAQPRIARQPDLSLRTRIAGHLPPWATAERDLGPIDQATQLDHLVLVLNRPAALEADLQQLLADQQNPTSPRYQQWLTPQQFAARYSAPPAEADALAAWLTAQGLTVDQISPSRTHITFSGPASSIARAFEVEFHRFRTTRGDLRATTTEPSIPAAFAAVVQGFVGLDEALSTTHSTQLPLQPMQTPGTLQPAYTLSGSTHWLSPADFAAIYDLNPVYNAGITGTGQRVAIIGASHVLPADIANFETLTALPQAQPTTLITPGTTDPGTTSNSLQAEATLDVDRVLATAPGAAADLVLIPSLLDTYTTAALQYILNTLGDPIINMSFGRCEAQTSAASFNSFNTLFAQAAAQGVTITVSSGDSAATGCESSGTTYSASLAQLSANFFCAPSILCVGGTLFADTASPATYWSSTNGTGKLSALSYIPEGAWNEPTSTSNGVVSYVVLATGGGASVFAAKPSWQVGTGVPADAARDTPDVSFSASAHNAYAACLAYSGADCTTYITGFAGTSASAPSMAAIVALANQKLGRRQGNFNPTLYQLALTPANGVFHDATPTTSGVATCTVASASACNNSAPGTAALTGGAAGYALTTGYDLATGLGSIDVAKLLTAAAASGSFSLTPASSSVTLTSGTQTTNTITAASANGFTGTIQLTCSLALTSGALAAIAPSCTVTPASIAYPTATTATVTVATVAPHALPVHAAGLIAGILLLGGFAFSRRRAMPMLTAVLALVFAIATLSGCGSSGSAASTVSLTGGTTTGVYTVTIASTNSKDATTPSATFALTIQ